MFRKVYPFSPALVQTLVAVSSVLQRERTALKVMLQLLVDQRDTLKVGDIVPVGDLFDVVAHGDEAFSQDMAIHFENAKRLYHQKLLPVLEQAARNAAARRPGAACRTTTPSASAFRNDDRLVKTLLLSALVPEVESLRGLDRRAAGRAQSRDDQDADPRPRRRRRFCDGAGPGPRAWARSGSARRPIRRSRSSSRASTPRASSSRPSARTTRATAFAACGRCSSSSSAFRAKASSSNTTSSSGRTPSDRASCCSRTSASCLIRRSRTRTDRGSWSSTSRSMRRGTGPGTT